MRYSVSKVEVSKKKGTELSSVDEDSKVLECIEYLEQLQTKVWLGLMLVAVKAQQAH